MSVWCRHLHSKIRQESSTPWEEGQLTAKRLKNKSVQIKVFNLFTSGRYPLKQMVLGVSKQIQKMKGLTRKVMKTLILEASPSQAQNEMVILLPMLILDQKGGGRDKSSLQIMQKSIKSKRDKRYNVYFCFMLLLLLYSLLHIIHALQSPCSTYQACLYKINLQNNLNKDQHVNGSLINFGQ